MRTTNPSPRMTWEDANHVVVAHGKKLHTAEDFQAIATAGELPEGFEFDVRSLLGRTGRPRPIVFHGAGDGLTPAIQGVPLAQMAEAQFQDLTGRDPLWLEQVLAITGTFLNDVEPKDARSLEPALELLAPYIDGNVLISSMLPDTVAQVADRFPTGMILRATDPWTISPGLVRRLNGIGAQWVMPNHRLLRRVGAAGGRPLLPWTANDEADIKRCLTDPNTRGVISDEWQLALRIRTGLGLSA